MTRFWQQIAAKMSNALAKSAGLGALFDRPLASEGEVGASLGKPYAHSPWVQRAIKMVADPITAVSVRFSQDRRGSETLVQDPELLAFWERPAREIGGIMGRGDFLHATVGWLKLAGEAFWILDDTWMQRGGIKSRLILARPDRMTEIKLGGALVGWRFVDASGQAYALLPEQVIQTKFWNPYNEVRGLGEYAAAAQAAESDWLAGRFARDLMRNNGSRGEYIIAKGGQPTDEQREQIINQLRHKRALQANGKFAPVFLSGDIVIEDAKLQSTDAAYLANRIQNRHEIFIALGVPASMADVMTSYSIGSASDRFRLLEDSCIPLASKIADSMEIVSAKLLGAGVYAWFDWDEHSTMQAVRGERIDSAAKLWALGVPLKAINEYLQLGLPAVPGWEVGYLPFSVAPAGAMSDPATSPNYGENQDEEDAEEKIARMLQALGKPVAASVQEVPQLTCGPVESKEWEGIDCPCCGGGPVPDVTLRASDSPRQARWKTYILARRESEQDYKSKFAKVAFEARRQTLAKLNSQAKKGMEVIRAGAAADLIFDPFEFEQALILEMRGCARRTMQRAGSQAFAELKLDDVFSMPPAAALNFMKQRDNLMRGVAQSVFEQVMGTLQEGINSGETMEQLVDRVKASFNRIGEMRARMIAQTETSAAYGAARQAALETSGIEYKTWLTSQNDNVRPTHIAAEAQVVPVSEPFRVGNSLLMHPGDGSLGADAGDVINCYCVSAAATAEEFERYQTATGRTS
jgi:phage portal protein BeeE